MTQKVWCKIHVWLVGRQKKAEKKRQGCYIFRAQKNFDNYKKDAPTRKKIRWEHWKLKDFTQYVKYIPISGKKFLKCGLIHVWERKKCFPTPAFTKTEKYVVKTCDTKQSKSFTHWSTTIVKILKKNIQLTWRIKKKFTLLLMRKYFLSILFNIVPAQPAQLLNFFVL